MVQGVPDNTNKTSDSLPEITPDSDNSIEDITQPAESVQLKDEVVLSNETKITPKPSDIATPKTPKPSGTLHLLSYLLWEREGVETFEVTRAQLLDTIMMLTEQLRTPTDAVEQLKHVILGGQTVLIEDIAAVRSDLVALLTIYNAGGRFGIGPWYVQVDSLLVSGESLIRNLLLGRTDVTRHGIALMDAAFMPHAIENDVQLPQILAGFNISAMMITSPQAVMPLPFRWVAPDGNHVLVINHHPTQDVSSAIDEQRFAQPDGPFLWLNSIDGDRELAVSDISTHVKMPIIQSTLKDYVAVLRDGLPDEIRPALKGELRLLGPGYQAGRFSTRMYLKQANARLQSLLTHQTEPWLAIALTNGILKSSDNLRALLDHSWRELMKNQSRNNLTGCSHDTVTHETEIRNQRILDVTQRIQDKSLDALPGTLTRTSPPSQRQAKSGETFIGVWNSHNYIVEQIVSIDLMLPDDHYPNVLLDHNNEEVNFSWEAIDESRDYTCRLAFRAKVDPVGYAVYSLKLKTTPPESHHNIITNKGNVIGNVKGETLLVEKGQLVWSRNQQRITDFLSFHDGGDAGDTYDYIKPQPDVMVRAGMTDMVSVQSTATHERLIFRERMRIAPELRPDLSRVRGLSLLDITTTATFYDNVPGIYFQTTFTNKAKDHRLRAHIQTGIKSDVILTDGTFGLTKRKIITDGTQTIANPQVNIFPMQTLAAVKGDKETLVLMTRGLSEVEPIVEKDEVTLALTLLRSIGWLKRGNQASDGIPAIGAQYERDITLDYAILPISNANPSKILRAGQAYNSPLQAFQYQEKPNPMTNRYLIFDNDSAIMTALKPPQTGKGWIVRLLNPTDTELRGTLTTHSKLSSAKLVNLAEEDQAEYVITKNKINVKIAPNTIHTLRLEF